MMTPRDTFSFRKFVLADAARYFQVFSGSTETPSKVRVLLILLSPRFIPVLLYRAAYAAYNWHLSPLAKLISLLNFFVFGIEISSRCFIGKGLIFPHTHGTVIGAHSIGENAIIFQGVTIGAKTLDAEYGENTRPIIHDNVTLGAGSKVLGNILIESFVEVGANAVVLKSVPANSIAVGIPARIINKNVSSGDVNA